MGGGKGPLIQEEKSGTLATFNDQVLFVDARNMTVDTVAPAQQNAYAHTNNGGGLVLGFYTQMKAECMTPLEEASPTLVNGTAPGYWNGVVENYVVRRLTPTECARLQGFPDWWCDDLVEEDPDLEFWRGVWDTWCDTNGKKHKTDSEILRWLKKPYSEAEEYKMWGNGVALPCVEFVMKGIVAWDAGKIPEDEETLPLLAWFEEERK